jgi:hypothetical protein
MYEGLGLRYNTVLPHHYKTDFGFLIARWHYKYRGRWGREDGESAGGDTDREIHKIHHL